MKKELTSTNNALFIVALICGIFAVIGLITNQAHIFATFGAFIVALVVLELICTYKINKKYFAK